MTTAVRCGDEVLSRCCTDDGDVCGVFGFVRVLGWLCSILKGIVMATWEALRLTEATMALIKSDATSKAVALELGVSKTTVCKYRREFVGRKRHYVEWPSDPAWYEERTMPDIVQALNCRVDTASLHIKKHGYTYRKGRWARSLLTGKRPGGQPHRPPKYNYPESRSFWEARTIKQMAAIVGCGYGNAERWARKHGYVMKKQNRRIPWPTDASWYAERTAQEIAGILMVIDDQVYLHARKHGYTTKSPELSRYDWKYRNKNTYENERRG